MRALIIKSALLLLLAVVLSSLDLPKGWIIAGSKPECYEMGIDNGAGQEGGNAATIKSIKKRINGFGTLMQKSKAVYFAGKRVRMSGYVKSEDVKESAGLWLRVDPLRSSGMKPLAFDNMQDRPIQGTTGWTKYEVVLDVSEKASMLAYGALLVGRGQIWFDKINFEVVDSTVKTTNTRPNLPDESYSPTNLDFEK